MSQPSHERSMRCSRACLAPLVLLALFAGCDCTKQEAQETPAASDDFGQPTTAQDPPEDPAEDEAAPDPGPAPRVQIGTEVTPGGQVKLRLQQRDDEPVELATQLTIERKHEGGEWRREVGVGELKLRASCEGEVPTCITLVPGAELSPPPWLGTRGDAQCVCERCTPTEPGTYRVVVRTCGDTHQIPSAPFIIPE